MSKPQIISPIDRYGILCHKKELTDKEWDEWETLRLMLFCNTPIWGLFECTGEMPIEFVQYHKCKVCLQWYNQVLFMSNKVALRENMDTTLICRNCYPDAIKHKRPPVDNRPDGMEIVKQFERDMEIVNQFKAKHVV